MNKIILVVLFALLGAALYIFVWPIIQPAIPIIPSLIQSIPTDLAEVGGWIQSNLTAIIPTAAGVGTVATLLYNQVYKRAKEAQEQIATQKVSEVQNQLLGQINENEALKQTNVQLQTQLDQSQDAQGQIATLNQTLTAKQKEVDKLIVEKNQMKRDFEQKYFPKEESVKVK